jgi:hypothetical protein
MQQILKRLELIKTGIALEDEEVLTLQVDKLSSLDVDATVSGILSLMADFNYGSAAQEINAYLLKYSGMTVYEDQELQGLRMELKSLESRVQTLSEERDECFFTIHEFNTRYTATLGDLIKKILRTKADRLFERITDDDPEVETKRAAYAEAEQDFQEFNEEAEELVDEDWVELSDENLSALKKAYRKASRLCHPDLVADELKSQAHQMMQQLNDAYEKRDLTLVEKILAALESGQGFELASDTVTDKALLKSKIAALRNKIDELSGEIDALQADETFELIQGLDNWNEYFDAVRQQLAEEYEAMVARTTSPNRHLHAENEIGKT